MKIKQKKLEKAVDAFVKSMKERLAEQECKGKKGWDGEYPLTDLICELSIDVDNYRTGNHSHETLSLDIANRAMMIWYRANKCR